MKKIHVQVREVHVSTKSIEVTEEEWNSLYHFEVEAPSKELVQDIYSRASGDGEEVNLEFSDVIDENYIAPKHVWFDISPEENSIFAFDMI